jgi:hypothetical protein
MSHEQICYSCSSLPFFFLFFLQFWESAAGSRSSFETQWCWVIQHAHGTTHRFCRRSYMYILWNAMQCLFLVLLQFLFASLRTMKQHKICKCVTFLNALLLVKHNSLFPSTCSVYNAHEIGSKNFEKCVSTKPVIAILVARSSGWVLWIIINRVLIDRVKDLSHIYHFILVHHL